MSTKHQELDRKMICSLTRSREAGDIIADRIEELVKEEHDFAVAVDQFLMRLDHHEKAAVSAGPFLVDESRDRLNEARRDLDERLSEIIPNR